MRPRGSRTPDPADVRTPVAPGDGTRAYRWYLAVTIALTALHIGLPAEARSVTYLLVSAGTVVPLAVLLRRQNPADRLPWWLLLVAMTVLTVGNGLTAVGGSAQRMNAEIVVTFGHASVLAAAISLVWRRGRNDIGGLLDVSVAAIGLGGLLWTTLVYPRLLALHTGPAEQAALLLSILVLAGVLGALIRVQLVAERRLPALSLMVAALVLALVGNVILAMSTGTMTTGRPGWIEIFFMVAYIAVGASPLHPSVHELAEPGPAPADRLSTGRLVFLGAAVVVNPVAGGVREMIGLPADGPLLALGCLLVAPLVMIRVGRLAHQRQRAEAALLHQATHDTLTGLPNRAELLTRLDAALAEERVRGRPDVVLLFCDLNGFKQVNDRLGHVAGDRLLAEVGDRIAVGLRSRDTLARYGGDEFLVLCTDPAQEAAVVRLCAHIEGALARPFRVAGQDIEIGSSIGAVISAGDRTADELITRADQAMYRAKQLHRLRTARDAVGRVAVRVTEDRSGGTLDPWPSTGPGSREPRRDLDHR